MDTPGSVRVLVGTLLATVVLSFAGSGYAQTLEYAVKANYLVRFAVFVQWPPHAFASADAPVIICIAGRDPFGAALTDAAGAHTAHGRPIVARSVGRADRVRGCHIVYLGARAPDDIAAAAASTSGVLLVSDEGASSRGGAVHLVVADGRVRFHIDNHAARRADLSISSRLMSLALSVRGSVR